MRIRDGTAASARVAAKLAQVLDAWAAEHARDTEKCARSSLRIRTALRLQQGGQNEAATTAPTTGQSSTPARARRGSVEQRRILVPSRSGACTAGTAAAASRFATRTTTAEAWARIRRSGSPTGSRPRPARRRPSARCSRRTSPRARSRTSPPRRRYVGRRYSVTCPVQGAGDAGDRPVRPRAERGRDLCKLRSAVGERLIRRAADQRRRPGRAGTCPPR